VLFIQMEKEGKNPLSTYWYVMH